MKKILSISILALFLIFGISCVSAADPDSNCIQEINLGSGIGGGEYTPFYADLESGIGGGEYTPFYCANLNCNYLSLGYHGNGMGGNPFDPHFWDDSYPGGSLYGPTPENHNLQ